tara:strand:+ start:2997 stop:3275 length:279 start_codon:yes stop_codon:yes gene_type:complete
MPNQSNLDERIIDSLENKLVSLERSPQEKFTPFVAISMLSLHPACLLKGYIPSHHEQPTNKYRISSPDGELIEECNLASDASKILADLYKEV